MVDVRTPGAGQVGSNDSGGRSRPVRPGDGSRPTPGGPAADAAGSRDAEWDGDAAAALRRREYSRLDRGQGAYLDYTGGGLHADSQLRQHHQLLRDAVLGNPHSGSPASRRATSFVDAARRDLLAWLNADPDEYTVVFTPNASGALRLVGESWPFGPGTRFLLSADDHNSVNGIRRYARAAGADVRYLPIDAATLRHDPDVVVAALEDHGSQRPGLFAFPAQSNYSGVQHPLEWIDAAKGLGWDVLLDAAAYLPTNRLDVGRWHPDFVSLSCYKLFGYPTGIGALVARREALARLRRPWFAGGTIGVASVVVEHATLAPAETGFEDGTIDYLMLPAVSIGLRHLDGVGIDVIGRRVRYLTGVLLDTLLSARHPDGSPMIRLYGPTGTTDRGGTVPFNVLDRRGSIIGFWKVEACAAERGVSIRTGCFCNPGASETARGITAADMAAVFALGRQPTITDLAAIMPGKALGAVRASVGIATVPADLDRLLEVIHDVAEAGPRD